MLTSCHTKVLSQHILKTFSMTLNSFILEFYFILLLPFILPRNILDILFEYHTKKSIVVESRIIFFFLNLWYVVQWIEWMHFSIFSLVSIQSNYEHVFAILHPLYKIWIYLLPAQFSVSFYKFKLHICR